MSLKLDKAIVFLKVGVFFNKTVARQPAHFLGLLPFCIFGSSELQIESWARLQISHILTIQWASSLGRDKALAVPSI